MLGGGGPCVGPPPPSGFWGVVRVSLSLLAVIVDFRDLVTSGSMAAEVKRLVEAGAELVEVRQDPGSFDNPDTWTVLRDPEGNEFCVTSTATLTGLE